MARNPGPCAHHTLECGSHAPAFLYALRLDYGARSVKSLSSPLRLLPPLVGRSLSGALPAAKQSPPRRTARHRALLLCLGVLLLTIAACARGGTELHGWTALQPGVELRSEPGRGPNGEDVVALLYALVPGNEYGIERQMPVPGLDGRPSLSLMAKSTRMLYLTVVLLDGEGREFKSAIVLDPGEWRTLRFDTFEPSVDDWSQISAIRLMDYTGLLIGQGSVSLKLVGLPH